MPDPTNPRKRPMPTAQAGAAATCVGSAAWSRTHTVLSAPRSVPIMGLVRAPARALVGEGRRHGDVDHRDIRAVRACERDEYGGVAGLRGDVEPVFDQQPGQGRGSRPRHRPGSRARDLRAI